jgi:hypothetical protein
MPTLDAFINRGVVENLATLQPEKGAVSFARFSDRTQRLHGAVRKIGLTFAA